MEGWVVTMVFLVHGSDLSMCCNIKGVMVMLKRNKTMTIMKPKHAIIISEGRNLEQANQRVQGLKTSVD